MNLALFLRLVQIKFGFDGALGCAVLIALYQDKTPRTLRSIVEEINGPDAEVEVLRNTMDRLCASGHVKAEPVPGWKLGQGSGTRHTYRLSPEARALFHHCRREATTLTTPAA